MTKTIDQNFIDWEAEIFGFGYGTGEPHTLAALKKFLDLTSTTLPRGYDYRELERELSPTVAWLLINILCNADIIEYGTSPRGGWLTKKGEALKSFIDSKSVDELTNLCCDHGEGYTPCMSDYCNCDPPTKGRREAGCDNPFWNDETE